MTGPCGILTRSRLASCAIKSFCARNIPLGAAKLFGQRAVEPKGRLSLNDFRSPFRTLIDTRAERAPLLAVRQPASQLRIACRCHRGFACVELILDAWSRCVVGMRSRSTLA